jgi:hypothetical protein
MYIGSRAFSSVTRYLTLSLASLIASVSLTSVAFQLRCDCDRAAVATPSTSRDSRD